MRATIRACYLSLSLCIVAVNARAQGQMGHVLDAVGPVNQSMAGAGTALPLDAMGALHWNPASISGLPGSEIGFGFMGFAPETELASRVDAGAFGPGMPAVTMQGVTKSDTDIVPIPSLACVYRNPASPWTIGLGGVAIGGFGVDFPASNVNPILTPQPADGGIGFGAIYSQFQLLQFCPTVSYRMSNGWSIGVAPTFNWATLAIAPFSAATPNADGSYPSGAHGDASWGMGIQVGTFYEWQATGWNFGLSYKSPQWFQDFELNGMDELGNPRRLTLDLDYPGIFSMGVAYRGIPRVNLAWDIRYIDYENADGFQEAGYDVTGAVTGFGWSSIWTTSLGAEFAVTDNLRWRCGYAFNESPISNPEMFYNSPAPALVQHHLSTGFTYQVASGWTCSVAYHHGFQNSISGRWWHPTFGSVPGTNVTGTLATHGLVGGISKRF
ncbi:MAG: outer membrane protein transport protein [Planctomycetales bacterium]|nr:outer membrane protein transport protein [Planctomycetales bacterium]